MDLNFFSNIIDFWRTYSQKHKADKTNLGENIRDEKPNLRSQETTNLY